MKKTFFYKQTAQVNKNDTIHFRFIFCTGLFYKAIIAGQIIKNK